MIVNTNQANYRKSAATMNVYCSSAYHYGERCCLGAIAYAHLGHDSRK